MCGWRVDLIILPVRLMKRIFFLISKKYFEEYLAYISNKCISLRSLTTFTNSAILYNFIRLLQQLSRHEMQLSASLFLSNFFQNSFHSNFYLVIYSRGARRSERTATINADQIKTNYNLSQCFRRTPQYQI